MCKTYIARMILAPLVACAFLTQTCFASDTILVKNQTDFEKTLVSMMDISLEQRSLLAKNIAQNHEAFQGTLYSRLAHIAGMASYARNLDFLDSLSGRYGSKLKERLEAIYPDNSNNRWVNTLYGAWHYEVRQRGGSIGSGILGASQEDGQDLFKKGISSSDNPLLFLSFAISAASLDAEGMFNQIQRSLNNVQHFIDKKERVYDVKKVKHIAKTLLSLMEQKNYEAAEGYAKKIM